MDPYDSDSSLEETGDYTETNVNLGYASNEPTGDTISHLGGFPTWLDSAQIPSASFARCKVCSSPMSLLLHLNGDLPEHFPNDERRLHIFTCRKKQCSRKAGSIRALREVRKSRVVASTQDTKERAPPSSESQKQPIDLGATLFGASSSKSHSNNANPFSTSLQPSSTSSNPFTPLLPTSTLAAKSPQPPQPPQPPLQPEEPPTSTFASKLQISSPPPSSNPDPRSSPAPPSPPSPWPPSSAFPTPYPHHHLDSDYETLTSDTPQLPPPSSSSNPNRQYTEEDSTTTDGLDKEKDLFESTLDRTFLKFSDRLAQNPSQVLRYEWSGTPLLYSSTDAVGKRLAPTLAAMHAKIKTTASAGMPRCEACGAERVFELQLVPGLIAALEEEEMDLESGMEWGTVIVGVCEKNCGEAVGKVGFREEWCGVQWEERG